MLKITRKKKAEAITLQLEGAVAGPWVTELNGFWHSLRAQLAFTKLSLDLREVTRIDADGRELLAEILRETRADVQTSSLLIEAYVREAQQKNLTNGNGAKK